MLHEVLSRQQFHFRRASKHRVLDRSADPHRRIHQRRDAVLHTDFTEDSTDADCTMRSVATRGGTTSRRKANPNENATSASRTQQQQQQQQQCTVTCKLTG